MRRGRVGSAALVSPALLWWAGLLVLPVGLVLAYSFFERGVYGGVVYDWTLDNYRRAWDPLYLGVLGFSVRVALESTVVSLLIGFPVALFIATRPARWRTVLLVLVILPFWTSLLIRTYAWIVILNDEGIANRALRELGLVEGSVRLLYNEFAIVVGMVSTYLPLMILPIYAALERLGPELVEAAADLGANAWKRLWTVLVPLTLPGIAAGCIFVFVPSLGNFIIPDLLGGGRRQMVGTLVQSQFLEARDWPFGATLAVSLIAMLLALVLMQAWLGKRSSREEAVTRAV
ncbi:MAG: spermidine/putrescine ABC transporter permease [Gaiellaceae bacterium]|nr:MAG: spermidine/putrescine ABC transporter permease [Gaiellaceae bacterium]